MKILKSKKLLATVAVGLMISLVAGMGAMTFARYISSGNHADTATAAKWGYVVNLNANNLFSTDYVKGTGDYSVPTADNNGVAINAANRSLAPGASGSMTVSISGKAEVLAELVISLDITSDIHLGNDYYPIKWSLATQTGEGTLVPVAGAQDLKLDAFKAKLASISQKLTVGTELDVKYVISWKWDFNDGDTDAAIEASMKDTLIGYKSQGFSYAELEDAIAPDMETYQDKITEAEYTNEGYEYISCTLAFTFTATVQQIQA